MESRAKIHVGLRHGPMVARKLQAPAISDQAECTPTRPSWRCARVGAVSGVPVHGEQPRLRRRGSSFSRCYTKCTCAACAGGGTS